MQCVSLRVAPTKLVGRPRSVSCAAGASGPVKKVVLAYSGGLDTSVILKWLQVGRCGRWRATHLVSDSRFTVIRSQSCHRYPNIQSKWNNNSEDYVKFYS